MPAACIGMFICYGQVDRRPAEDFCLHRIMALPTPLGAEATAIVRGKDENSPHLRQAVASLNCNHGHTDVRLPEKGFATSFCSLSFHL